MKQILLLFFILFGSFSCAGLKKKTLYDLIKKHFTEPLNNNMISSVKLSKPEYYYDMLNNDTINEMYSFIRFNSKEGKMVQQLVNEFQYIDDGEYIQYDRSPNSHQYCHGLILLSKFVPDDSIPFLAVLFNVEYMQNTYAYQTIRRFKRFLFFKKCYDIVVKVPHATEEEKNIIKKSIISLVLQAIYRKAN